MGKTYDFETRDRAEDLYICQGLTLEQVASTTGVSLSQVKEWSTTDNWRERRDEYRLALREIKMDTVRLRQKLIKKALDTLNPQYAYAAANVERMAHQVAPKPGAAGENPELPELREMPEPPTEIRTPEQAVAALQEAAAAKLVIMLSRPGELDRKALKDYQDMLTLIDELKNKYAPQEAGRAKTDLDDETKQRIRDIYGL